MAKKDQSGGDLFSRLVAAVEKSIGRWQALIGGVSIIAATVVAIVVFVAPADVLIEDFSTKDGYTIYNNSWTPVFVVRAMLKFRSIERTDSIPIGKTLDRGQRVVVTEMSDRYKIESSYKVICSHDPIVDKAIAEGSPSVRLAAFSRGHSEFEMYRQSMFSKIDGEPLILPCAIAIEYRKANRGGDLLKSKAVECNAVAFGQTAEGSELMSDAKFSALCFGRNKALDAPTPPTD